MTRVFRRSAGNSTSAPARNEDASRSNPNYFETIFDGRPADASGEAPFDSAEWLDNVEAYVNSLLALEASDRLPIEHYIVPACMAAAEVATRGGDVRILDFGGGLGVNYINIRAVLPRSVTAYDIVDTPPNRQRWQRLFGHHANCGYHIEIPPRQYDVVLASSTLQYIHEWRGALASLARVGAHWIVLPRLPVTTGRTFAAIQDVKFNSGPHIGKSAGRVRHWFFNRDAILELMRTHGFQMAHEHFIADYGAQLAHLSRPAGDVTLRVLTFSRADYPPVSPVRVENTGGNRSAAATRLQCFGSRVQD